jgi:membrane protease YdiL (CAAX protease family)
MTTGALSGLPALPALTADSLVAIVLLSTAVVCYTIHHYLGIAFFRRRLAARGVDGDSRERSAVLLQRASGVVLLGLVPITIAFAVAGGSAADYGLTLRFWWLSAAIGVTGAVAVLLPCALFLSRSPGLLLFYPEMRVHAWPSSLAAINTASWIVYLAAYELFFRGILVCRLVPVFGFWPAIFVGSAMYAFVHLPKHPIECWVVVFGGTLFGFTAAYTGSIFGPYLAHAMLAAGAELLAVRSSPDRHFGRPSAQRGLVRTPSRADGQMHGRH